MSTFTREELEKKIFDTEPRDGLRVDEVRLGDERSLHIGFYVKGRPVELFQGLPATRQVWNRDRKLTDKECGQRDRAKLFLEAACRFFNTGGKWPELDWLLSEVQKVTPDDSIDRDGFELINSQFNTDGVCEHLFAREGCPHLIRWVEGQFLDVLSETELLNEAKAEEKELNIQEGNHDASGPQYTGPGGGCRNQLPGPGDSDSPPQDGEVAQ